MATDVEALLRRVVAELIGGEVKATYSVEPKNVLPHRVRLTTRDGRRSAALRGSAAAEWFEADLLELDVTDYVLDHDGVDNEAGLRELAQVVRAYLQREERIERRRGFARSYLVLTVQVDGQERELSRRWRRSDRVS